MLLFCINRKDGVGASFEEESDGLSLLGEVMMAEKVLAARSRCTVSFYLTNGHNDSASQKSQKHSTGSQALG